MAQIVEKLPDSYEYAGRGPEPLHPYDEWLDGQARILSRGEDFTHPTKVVLNRIRTQAHKRNLRVDVRRSSTHLAIQAVPKEDHGR